MERSCPAPTIFPRAGRHRLRPDGGLPSAFSPGPIPPPAGARIDGQLSVRRTILEGETERCRKQTFFVLLNYFCFLMVAKVMASPSREELFIFQILLAEAALRRLHARTPGTSRARLARAEVAETPPLPALPHLRCPLPLLRRRSRAQRAPPSPSSPPAVSSQLTTRSSRRGRGSQGLHTTLGRTRTRRPGPWRKTRRSLNAAAMPVSVSSAA